MNIEFTEKIQQFINDKIPLIQYTDMSIVNVDDTSCIITIPLSDKTKNHFNSMYFGALAIGADCAGGLIALYYMDKFKVNLSLAFKNFQADFIKRAENDVFFACNDGLIIQQKIKEALQNNMRVSFPVNVIAYVLQHGQKEIVANFILTLSLKP